MKSFDIKRRGKTKRNVIISDSSAIQPIVCRYNNTSTHYDQYYCRIKQSFEQATDVEFGSQGNMLAPSGHIQPILPAILQTGAFIFNLCILDEGIFNGGPLYSKFRE
jgi:hypothetical protein